MGICDSQNGASLPLGTHCVLLTKPERSLENESMALQTSLVQSIRSWGNKAATKHSLGEPGLPSSECLPHRLLLQQSLC